MRLLILFSMWSPDRSTSSKNWLDYYTSRLSDCFPNDDKFIAINGNEDAVDRDAISVIPHVIGVSSVPDGMVINSDASGYQHALNECAGILSNYDAICFFHTKGISYKFEDVGWLRDEVDASIFDRSRIIDALGRHDRALVAIKGFLSPSADGNRKYARLAASAGIAQPSVHYLATWTLYAASTSSVVDMMDCLPAEVKSKNLLSIGETRYFFEAAIPSLLSAKGATPVFLCGEEFAEGVNRFVSFDAMPSHNCAILSAEFAKRDRLEDKYRQLAVPYVFGSLDQVRSVNIAFDFDE